MTDQDIVDDFAKLIIGQSVLIPGDPRTSLIQIATICLHEFVGMTRYAYEHGLIQNTEPAPEFEPQFKVVKDD